MEQQCGELTPVPDASEVTLHDSEILVQWGRSFVAAMSSKERKDRFLSKGERASKCSSYRLDSSDVKSLY